MKRIIVLFLTIITFSAAEAQQKPPKHPRGETSVIEMVSDLSSVQKRKLENLQKEARNRIEPLKQQRKAVGDSIRAVIDEYGDHSKEIYPLIERDSYLQAEIAREYYRVKIKIDEILTKEQQLELVTKMNAKRVKKKH